MSNLYYYKENGEEKGPFSLQELEAQHLTLDTQVLSPLTTGWQAAADLPELTSYFYKQGIYLIGEDNLAGFWLRLLAWVIDLCFPGNINYHTGYAYWYVQGRYYTSQ